MNKILVGWQQKPNQAGAMLSPFRVLGAPLSLMPILNEGSSRVCLPWAGFWGAGSRSPGCQQRGCVRDAVGCSEPALGVWDALSWCQACGMPWDALCRACGMLWGALSRRRACGMPWDALCRHQTAVLPTVFLAPLGQREAGRVSFGCVLVCYHNFSLTTW